MLSHGTTDLIVILIALTVVVVYLNLRASFRLLREQELTGLQKSVQLLIVWLVPVFGALFVLHLLSEFEEASNGWDASTRTPNFAPNDLRNELTTPKDGRCNDGSDSSSGDCGGV